MGYIERAARRATLKWSAGQKLLRELKTHGADAEVTKRQMEKLAETLQENPNERSVSP